MIRTHIFQIVYDIMYKPFKNMKVSFILLLSFVVGIYIIIFSIVNTSGDSRSIIFLEMILWVALIVILYVNIKNYDDNNLDFQTKFKNLFNSKLAEMEVTSKGSKQESDKENPVEESTCENEGEGEKDKEVFIYPKTSIHIKKLVMHARASMRMTCYI